MSGGDVKMLQIALGGLKVDGSFGAKTEAAVTHFQQANGLTADGIVGKKTWHALGVTNRYINEIIVHCTATVEGVPCTVEQIDYYHRKERGFKSIGYHFVIYFDGSVHLGRSIDEAGAHCTGHNKNSIGVCYVGGLGKNREAKDTRTLAQKAALLDLVRRLKRVYPSASVHGHRDFANKACPSFDATNEYKAI